MTARYLAYCSVQVCCVVVIGCKGNRSLWHDYRVFDAATHADSTIALQESSLVVRFCGCSECHETAQKLTLTQKSRINYVIFNGPEEEMIKFRREVNWPEIHLLESDAKWAQAFGGYECPYIGVYSTKTHRFTRMKSL